jgi:hypothetical protein
MLQESNKAEHLGAFQSTVFDLIVRRCFGFKGDPVATQTFPDVMEPRSGWQHQHFSGCDEFSFAGVRGHKQLAPSKNLALASSHYRPGCAERRTDGWKKKIYREMACDHVAGHRGGSKPGNRVEKRRYDAGMKKAGILPELLPPSQR